MREKEAAKLQFEREKSAAELQLKQEEFLAEAQMKAMKVGAGITSNGGGYAGNYLTVPSSGGSGGGSGSLAPKKFELLASVASLPASTPKNILFTVATLLVTGFVEYNVLPVVAILELAA